MDVRPWPTFGQVLGYLRGFGFTTRTNREGAVVCEHPEEGSWFLFRNRDPDSPARETELLDLKAQLTGRGFVTDEKFARFWDRSARPAPAENPR